MGRGDKLRNKRISDTYVKKREHHDVRRSIELTAEEIGITSFEVALIISGGNEEWAKNWGGDKS